MARVLVDLLSYTGKKGGLETYARELYRELGTMSTGHEYVGYAPRELATIDHSWFPGDIIWSKIRGENRLAWAFGELVRVSRIADRVGADLIHSPTPLGPWRSHVPTLYSMHDMNYFTMPQHMVVKAYTKPVQWMERRSAANAARILTLSEASAKDIVEHLGFPRDRIDVIPLAGSAPRFPLAVNPTRERALFLGMGSRAGHKNWPMLIRAVAETPEPDRPRLVITGSWGDDPLKPIVRSLGLEDWVELRGWASDEDIGWLFSHATALVVPAVHDGFCLPALEAMHAGLPVLMSDIPVFHEVGGDAVGYFDPHDPRDISRVLVRASSEPAWTAELAERGFRHTAGFTWRRVAEETLRAFDAALAAKGDTWRRR